MRYFTIRLYIPEDSKFHTCRLENLKSHKLQQFEGIWAQGTEDLQYYMMIDRSSTIVRTMKCRQVGVVGRQGVRTEFLWVNAGEMCALNSMKHIKV
jgi:hypothetical protein